MLIEPKNLIKPAWRPTNPHDRFCRTTAFHPLYAPDFLMSFGDPILAKYIVLDQLQEAPTTHLSEGLKEVIMDASLTTRLRDTATMSEVLLHLEHKSRPSKNVAIQLLMEVSLSLHFRWFLSNKTESGSFVPPIPLMVVVYNGNKDWEGEIWFQDLFPNLPAELRPFVPQFKIFFINLKHFSYTKLPGKPQTRAIAESLKRATDGTFVEYLPSVLKHVANADMGERQKLNLTQNIASYCTWTAGATTEQIIKAITTVFKKQEGITMIEGLNNSFVLEGIEIGEARGELRGKIESKAEDVITILRLRFSRVPLDVAETIREMTDVIALESLLQHAVTCVTLKEFTKSLA